MIEGYPIFKPNFDNYNKLLIVDGVPANDLSLAKVMQGTVLDEFQQTNDLVNEIENDGVSDEDLFSSVVPKSVQSYGEISTYLENLKNS